MSLLDLLVPTPPMAEYQILRQVERQAHEPVSARILHKRGWARPERRSKQDRIEQEQRLDAELRARREQQAARWKAEELARQGQPLPDGVKAVEHQESGQAEEACEMCGAMLQEIRCNVPCPSCGWTRTCEP